MQCDGCRFRLVNAWKPLNPIVYDYPLALCDRRTIRSNDILAYDRVHDKQWKEAIYPRFTEYQQWFWLPEQTRNELTVFTIWDSGSGPNTASGCPHASFAIRDTLANVPPRESVELRLLVVQKA